ncbi:BnaA10g13250D [Brassica napus]|uniref:BnaA10g13250D protein n=1 Tax=Brassica napus TaxID=3708 RepID=A0A078H1B8_BRANA|nr:BnaA10g13250D [Brassica napus]
MTHNPYKIFHPIATTGRGRPVWLRSWFEMKGIVYVINGISKGQLWTIRETRVQTQTPPNKQKEKKNIDSLI